MPLYSYTAKNFDGETKTGTFDAKDEHQLYQDLKNQGLVLISAILGSQPVKKNFDISLPILGRISSTEKIMMLRNLRVMISAGLSIVKAFSILSSQTKNKKLKIILFSIKEHINKGETLSSAMARHPSVFSPIFLSMIKVGEESGNLDEVLKNLSLQMEKDHQLKSAVKNAMIYPCIILSAMAIIGTLLLIFIVPKITDLYKTLNATLPLASKIMIFAGNFMVTKWHFVLAGIIILALGIKAGRKTKKGRWLLDTALLKIPVVAPLIKKSGCASMVRSLGSLIASGVPIVKSLDIISGTLPSIYFENALQDAKEKVKKGEKLSDALMPYQDIFSLGTIEMIEVGEETGETSAILKKLAEFYEEEVLNTTKGLSTVIEPVLMMVIGIAVGIFAISVIQPIYSILNSVQ